MSGDAWSSLAGVALGGVGSFLATRYFQNRADQREDARTLDTQRREEAARQYEHRRKAYTDFTTEWLARWDDLLDRREADGGVIVPPEPNELWHLYLLQSPLRVDGGEAVIVAAEEAYDALKTAVYGEINPSKRMTPDAAKEVFDRYIETVRTDLKIQS